MKQQVEVGVVRQILRSEITWITFLVGGIWAFVATVVLPIQALQIGQSRIESQLVSGGTKIQIIDARLITVEKEHAVMMNKLK